MTYQVSFTEYGDFPTLRTSSHPPTPKRFNDLGNAHKYAHKRVRRYAKQFLKRFPREGFTIEPQANWGECAGYFPYNYARATITVASY